MPMKPKWNRTRCLLSIAFVYALALGIFYIKYVPLVKSFQIVLVPILLFTVLLTIHSLPFGTLFFIFVFPLINNLPYFFGLFEPWPLAPSALVLCLFFFLGWILHQALKESSALHHENLSKPLVLWVAIILISACITFFRYTNFFPLLSDSIYEMTTNAFGVTSGGALMSVVLTALNYLSGLAFFLIFLQTISTKELLRKTLIVWCSSICLSLAFALYQHLGDIKFGNNPYSISTNGINATFKDSLSFGAFLSMSFPLLIGIFLAGKGVLRILAFLGILGSGYLIFFSASKISIASLLIVSILFVLLNFRKIRELLSIKIFRAVPIGALILVVAFLGFILIKNYISLEISKSDTYSRLDRVWYYVKTGNWQDIMAGRMDTLWNMAVAIIKDYPLTGVGIGAYIIESSNYSTRLKRPIGTPESAENYLLQVTSELGIIGLILVFWIFWEIIKQIKKAYKIIPSNDEHRFILTGAICGFGAFLLNSLMHSYIGSYEIKYGLWLLIGLVYILHHLHQFETPDRKEKSVKSDFPASGFDSRKLFGLRFKIGALTALLIFGCIHLWNSTHSLSLKSRTEQFSLNQVFGFDKLEKTADGREFRWTRGYGGMPLKIEKSVLVVPLHASHPDIWKKPVKVKIYLVKEFFKQKRLIKEITLAQNYWQDIVLSIPDDVGQKAILLLKVSRTWNPLKTTGVPDPRNLGVAVGKITFRDS